MLAQSKSGLCVNSVKLETRQHYILQELCAAK
jgi:hypothetical protein